MGVILRGAPPSPILARTTTDANEKQRGVDGAVSVDLILAHSTDAGYVLVVDREGAAEDNDVPLLTPFPILAGETVGIPGAVYEAGCQVCISSTAHKVTLLGSSTGRFVIFGRRNGSAS